MILPVGECGRRQQLELWWREQGAFENEVILLVAFVPLRGKNGWSKDIR